MSKGKENYIEKYHFYYSIGIALLIITIIFSIYFGGGDRAGNILGFAATLSSIILALIAILMTIVDLAGQRNTIADLKEVSKKLEANLTTANKGIEDIGAIKEELLSSMKTIISSNMIVSKEITELKAKYSVESTNIGEKRESNNKDILADLETLGSKVEREFKNFTYNDLRHRTFHDLSNLYSSNEELNTSKQIRNILLTQFKKNQKYLFEDITNHFDALESINISRPRLKHEIKRLVKSGVIKREEDRFYIIT